MSGPYENQELLRVRESVWMTGFETAIAELRTALRRSQCSTNCSVEVDKMIREVEDDAGLDYKRSEWIMPLKEGDRLFVRNHGWLSYDHTNGVTKMIIAKRSNGEGLAFYPADVLKVVHPDNA